MSRSETDLAETLAGARGGDPEAIDRLYHSAYTELRRIARASLRSRPSRTLDTTSLVNEAYVKLFEGRSPAFEDRTHFFAVSARAMRQILVDHFRARSARKRGAGAVVLTLDDALVPDQERGEMILAIHEALERLATHDERLARVVEYKFFGGMTEQEIAEVLQLTTRTVSNDWRLARAWLVHELGGASG